jgi:hypothetical protein
MLSPDTVMGFIPPKGFLCHCEEFASGEGRSNLIAIPVVAQFIGRFLPDPPKAETLLNS